MEALTRLLKSSFKRGYFINAQSICNMLEKERMEEFIKYLLRQPEDYSDLITDVLELYLEEELPSDSCDYCEDTPDYCDSCIIKHFNIQLADPHKDKLKMAYYICSYPEVINDYINSNIDDICDEDLFAYAMFGAEKEPIVVRLLLEQQSDYVMSLMEWYYPDGNYPWYVKDMVAVFPETAL